MASFKYDFFQGIRPRLSPRLLAHPQSQTMENARLGTGAIEPWKRTLLEQALTADANGIETIYRFRQGGLLRDRVWFEFADDVDLAKGPLLDDPLERTYYTGTAQATPRMTYETLVTTSGQQPNDFRILGIAPPAAAPTLVGESLAAAALTGSIVCTTESGNADGLEGGLTGIQTTTLKCDFSLEELGRLPYIMGSWFFGDDSGYEALSTNHTFNFDVQIGNELKILTVPSTTSFTAEDANGGSSIWKTTQQDAVRTTGGLNKMRDNDNGTARDGYFRFEVENGTLFTTDAVHNLLVDDVIRVSSIPDTLRFTIGNGIYKSGAAGASPAGGEFYGGELNAVGIDPDVDTWPDGHSTVGIDNFYVAGAAHAGVTVYWTLDGPSGTIDWPFEGTVDWSITERGGVPYNEIVTDQESRIYVYTWVTDLGEEGPPSDPSALVTIPTDGDVTVTLPSTAPSSNQTIANIRIYRANTGTSVSEFQFVAEEVVTGAGQTFLDQVLDTNLGEVLQTASWDAPDANMEGITALPNGVLAGFTGKDVQFSEPYFPHAWPPEYEIAVDHDVVGLGVLPTGTLVLTTGTPYMIVGNHPRAYSLRHFEFAQSCASKKSIVNTKDSIIYASPDGLIMIGPSGFNIITENYFTKKEWNELLDPTSIRGEWHDGRYFGYHNGGGFVFDPFDESIGFSTLSDTAFATHVDAETDSLYVIVCPPNATDLLVAVANDGSETNNIMTSPDGITWTQRTVTSGKTFECIAYSPLLCRYVAFASNAATSGAFTSTDGTTWTANAVDGSNFGAQDIIWSDYFDMFIAVGTSSTNGNHDAAWSVDGLTWETSNIAMTSVGQVIAEAPLLRKAIAIDNDSSTPNIYVTYDGKTWVDTGVDFPVTTIRGLAWSESLELFVAVNSGGALYWSADGLTWTLGDTQTAVDQDVVWSVSEALFVAVGDGGAAGIATSTDGKTWTARTNPDANLALFGVTYHASLDLFVAVGSDSGGTDNVLTSPDGITWTQRSDGIEKDFTDVGALASVTQSEAWAIRKWDGDGLPANHKTITWKSGQLRADYPFNLAVGRIISDTYPVSLEVFNEGVSKRTISVLDDEMFRMPSGFLGDYVELKIVHTGTIRSVMVAETAKELLDG